MAQSAFVSDLWCEPHHQSPHSNIERRKMKVFLVLLSVSGEKVQGTGSLLTIPMKRSGALLQLSRGRPSQDNLICLDKFSQLSVSCYSSLSWLYVLHPRQHVEHSRVGGREVHRQAERGQQANPQHGRQHHRHYHQESSWSKYNIGLDWIFWIF